MPPFTVLHVCMGNICRSPMAERLFAHALRSHLDGSRVDERYLSHGAGTGGWHVGAAMEPAAARQVRDRGADPTGFQARQLTGSMIDSADLVLTATNEQVDVVLDLRPDAAGRTFVLGEAGRLLAQVDPSDLPPAGSPTAAYQRGVALVAALDAARGGSVGAAARGGSAGTAARGGSAGTGGRGAAADDLADPYGRSDREFARVADQIEATVGPLAAALVG